MAFLRATDEISRQRHVSHSYFLICRCCLEASRRFIYLERFGVMTTVHDLGARPACCVHVEVVGPPNLFRCETSCLASQHVTPACGRYRFPYFSIGHRASPFGLSGKEPTSSQQQRSIQLPSIGCSVCSSSDSRRATRLISISPHQYVAFDTPPPLEMGSIPRVARWCVCCLHPFSACIPLLLSSLNSLLCGRGNHLILLSVWFWRRLALRGTNTAHSRRFRVRKVLFTDGRTEKIVMILSWYS